MFNKQVVRGEKDLIIKENRSDGQQLLPLLHMPKEKAWLKALLTGKALTEPTEAQWL